MLRLALLFFVAFIFQDSSAQKCSGVQSCMKTGLADLAKDRLNKVKEISEDRLEDVEKCFTKSGCEFNIVESSGPGGPTEKAGKITACLKDNVRDTIVEMMRTCVSSKTGVDAFDLDEVMSAEEFGMVKDEVQSVMKDKKKQIKSTCESLGSCSNSADVISCLEDLRSTTKIEMARNCRNRFSSTLKNMCDTGKGCLESSSDNPSGCQRSDLNNLRAAMCACQDEKRDEMRRIFKTGIANCMEQAAPPGGLALLQRLFGGLQKCIASQIEKTISDGTLRDPMCNAEASPCESSESRINDLIDDRCEKIEQLKESVKEGIAGCIKQNPFLGGIIGDRKITDESAMLRTCAEGGGSPFGGRPRFGSFGKGGGPPSAFLKLLGRNN